MAQHPVAGPAARWVVKQIIPGMKGVGYGVAGNYVYDEARDVWTWTTPNTRSGTIKTSAAIAVDSSSRETAHWHHNELTGGSYGSALIEDRQFGRYDITIQQVLWDPAEGKFALDHTHTYHGDTFQTAWGGYMTAQKGADGEWATGGWHLVNGHAEKSSVTHAIESRATVEDPSLMQIGDPGYTVTVFFTLSNMHYQGGGNWTYTPDAKVQERRRNLSAVSDDRHTVRLLTHNTKLTSKGVRGRSTLYWTIRSVPVTVELERRTFTFDQDNTRIPGPIETDRQDTNAPVWVVDQRVGD